MDDPRQVSHQGNGHGARDQVTVSKQRAPGPSPATGGKSQRNQPLTPGLRDVIARGFADALSTTATPRWGSGDPGFSARMHFLNKSFETNFERKNEKKYEETAKVKTKHLWQK